MLTSDKMTDDCRGWEEANQLQTKEDTLKHRLYLCRPNAKICADRQNAFLVTKTHLAGTHGNLRLQAEEPFGGN